MLLVVNAGSSSLKLSVFDAARAEIARASVTEIGASGELVLPGQRRPIRVADHVQALAAGLQGLALAPGALTAVAHRVVHGGADLTAPTRVTAAVEAGIAALCPLAPLHNPANLAGIRAMRQLAPDLAQYASFDTAFHATNPPEAVTYALPAEERARGLRRYGFHGISYAAIVRILRDQDALPDRLLVFHLGNGASACAIRGGVSVATTMGLSPVDGLTMGTRSGGIDPMAVLDLAARHGVDGAAAMLNRQSGLRGLAGQSDMRALQTAATPEADFARAHFAYWASRHAGSLIAAMAGLDGVVFTGGIGEHDAGIRAAILSGLAWAGARFCADANTRNHVLLHPEGAGTIIRIVPADEERQIALEASHVMQREG